MRCVNLATQHSALPWFASMRIHTADTVATLSSCVCVCVPRKWLHLKGICLYKILLFAIYTRRVLFLLSFYTHTHTFREHTYSSSSVLYVYMYMIYLCECRYVLHFYILYAFGFCKCCFLYTWHYIAYIYTHTETQLHRL